MAKQITALIMTQDNVTDQTLISKFKHKTVTSLLHSLHPAIFLSYKNDECVDIASLELLQIKCFFEQVPIKILLMNLLLDLLVHKK